MSATGRWLFRARNGKARFPSLYTVGRALPGILAGLQARGYELVPVSELLQAAGAR